jgi:hypothetical protein
MVSSGSLALTSTSSKHVATAGPKAFEDNSLIFILPSPDNKWNDAIRGSRPSMLAARPDEIEALWIHVIAGKPGN